MALVLLCALFFPMTASATHLLNLQTELNGSNNWCLNSSTFQPQFRIYNWDTVPVTVANLKIVYWLQPSTTLVNTCSGGQVFNSGGTWQANFNCNSTATAFGPVTVGSTIAGSAITISMSSGGNIPANGGYLTFNASSIQDYVAGWPNPANWLCDDYSMLQSGTYYEDNNFCLLENGTLVCEYLNSGTQDPNSGCPPGGSPACGTSPVCSAASGLAINDIGGPSPAGTASVSVFTYTIKAGGSNISGTSDQFSFDCETFAGDGTIIANILSIQNTATNARAGVMIRNSLNAADQFFYMGETPSSGSDVRYRTTSGGSATTGYNGAQTAPYWVKIVKSGTTFTGYDSPDGVNWTQEGTATISMGGTTYWGLAVCSHNNGTSCQVLFNNVCLPGGAAPSPTSTYTFTPTPTNIPPTNTLTPTNTYTPTITPTFTPCAQQTYTSKDLGGPSPAGSGAYAAGVYTVIGGGADIGTTSDQFQFYNYQPAATSNLLARVVSIQNVNALSKAGIMARDGSTNANDPFVFLGVTPSSGLIWESRLTTGAAATAVTFTGITAPYWVEIFQAGNIFTGTYSTDGVNWNTAGAVTIAMTAPNNWGMAVCSHNNGTGCTAKFDNVCTGSGAPAPTNTPTYTYTFTPTITPTPTLTYTPTNTFTPGIPNTPIPGSCHSPTGSDTTNFQGGVFCFDAPVADVNCKRANNNCNNLILDSQVFGMGVTDIKNIADYYGTSVGNPIPLNISSDWKLSYFDGPITYGPSQPAPYTRLHGYGILVINGDLVLQPPSGSNLSSSWGGVVFITGNLTLQDGAEIDGVVIMGKPYYHANTPGTISLTGSNGNYAQIYFSPALVTSALQLVAQYREDISERKTTLAIPNI
jgi:hypothetical protein